MRRFLIPAIAFLLAIATALFARSWLENRRPGAEATAAARPAEPASRMVLVAVDELRTGTFVHPQSVTWQAWPDVSLPANYYVKGRRDPEEIAGAVARQPVAKGQPIVDGMLVKPGERGFLAAVLGPGMRAVSIAIDDVAGNAGLIFPGDHVDLVLSQSLAAGGGEEDVARRVSETVLRDARVIAAGRRLARAGSEDSVVAGNQARTVTLEVSPGDAERVALASELGRLSLSLRSLAVEGPDGPVERSAGEMTWDRDVSRAIGRGVSPGDKVTVLRGGEAK